MLSHGEWALALPSSSQVYLLHKVLIHENIQKFWAHAHSVTCMLWEDKEYSKVAPAGPLLTTDRFILRRGQEGWKDRQSDCFSESWCWTAHWRPEAWHFFKKHSHTYVLEHTSTDLPSLPPLSASSQCRENWTWLSITPLWAPHTLKNIHWGGGPISSQLCQSYWASNFPLGVLVIVFQPGKKMETPTWCDFQASGMSQRKEKSTHIWMPLCAWLFIDTSLPNLYATCEVNV